MRANSEFGIWNGVVEYSYAVMEAVRAQAVDGYNSFGHGGLEIGGVLYGDRRGDVIRIVAAQPLECDHANGPGFVLSEMDQARFRELMKPRDGLRAIGWYTSHTRTGVVLNANDCCILERYFGERGSVVLLVKPTRHGPVEATFYIQGCAEPGPHFSVLVQRNPKVMQPQPGETASPAIVASEVELPPTRVDPPSSLPPVPPSRARRMPWVRWVGLGFALAVIGAWFISFQPAPKAATYGVRVGLQGYAIAGRQVRIEWDRSSAAVRTASAATLEILDGGARYALPLTATQLRTSSLTYARQSDRVEVRLKLATGAEEAVQVVVPSTPAAPASAKPAAPVTQTAEAKAMPPKEVNPSPITVVSAEEERNRESAEEPGPVRSASKQFEPVPEDRPAQAITLPDPPPAVGSPARLPLVAAMPKLPVSTVVPLPAVRTPRSGRMIWTGFLERHGVVEFEGTSATIGSLSGGLPGVAAKLAIYPAEFKQDRLIVYVPDAARHNRSEAPGPATGWNRLQFEWDPERSKQITLLEAPNSSNQFSRLALRNEARNCRVIVVEWRTE